MTYHLASSWNHRLCSSWIKLCVLLSRLGVPCQYCSQSWYVIIRNSHSLREAVLTPKVVGRLKSPQDCGDNHIFFGMDWLSFIPDKWRQGSGYSVKSTLSLLLSDTLQNRGGWWVEDSSKRPFFFQNVTWAKYNANHWHLTDSPVNPIVWGRLKPLDGRQVALSAGTWQRCRAVIPWLAIPANRSTTAVPMGAAWPMEFLQEAPWQQRAAL